MSLDNAGMFIGQVLRDDLTHGPSRPFGVLIRGSAYGLHHECRFFPIREALVATIAVDVVAPHQ